MTKYLRITTLALASGMVLGWTAHLMTADHHFVTMMIPYHMGAVDVAKIELKYGSDSLAFQNGAENRIQPNQRSPRTQGLANQALHPLTLDLTPGFRLRL